MEASLIFDIAATTIVALSSVLAYARGFVREVMSIAGWVVSAIVAYVLVPIAVPYVGKLPYLGEFLQGNCELSVIAAFVILFAISLIVIGLITSVLVQIAKMPAISALNQGLGFLFGVSRGVLLLIIALVLNDAILPQGQIYEGISQSQSAKIFDSVKILLQGPVANDAKDWLVAAFENVMKVCETEPQTKLET